MGVHTDTGFEPANSHLARLDPSFALLNNWQRGFPLVEQPFAEIGTLCGLSEAAVLDAYRKLLRDGAISRIGGVFGAGAGGAALLCAFAVPPKYLDAVAALVSAMRGVNHAYEREHRYNLWFVLTGRDGATVASTLDQIEARCNLTALRLPMQRAYRIDLGFDLRDSIAAAGAATAPTVVPVADSDAPFAALVEAGLPIVSRPYDAWAGVMRWTRERVIATLQRWLAQGTLRRFGAIVRHHEAGFTHNAMTVFDVPDDRVDATGTLLGTQRGVTLAYRRARVPGWPYNLYCMVHGRDRTEVQSAVDAATQHCGLAALPREVLFSVRRFKQGGASYFRTTQPKPPDGGSALAQRAAARMHNSDGVQRAVV